MKQARTVCDNRKAFHDFFIEERMEAGLVLTGTEVKSLRLGRVNLRDSFARIEKGEMWLYHVHIAPYEQGNRNNHDPNRPRKLLLHRREIGRLEGQVRQKGFTLVPLRLYFNEKGRAKVEMGLARGKHLYDKRESIAKRDAERDMQRELKENIRR